MLSPAEISRLTALGDDPDDPDFQYLDEERLADLADPGSPLDQVLTGQPGPAEAIPAGFTHGCGGPGDPPGGLGYGPGREFGAGGIADVMEPGAVLAALTGRAVTDGLGRLTDDELIGLALAAQRNASWQAWVELAAVSELSGRRRKAALDTRAAEHFGKEIAVAFTLTNRGADGELDLAAGLERLPEVAALLAAGVIDRYRARIITDELACLDADLARAAAALVLPRAQEIRKSRLLI